MIPFGRGIGATQTLSLLMPAAGIGRVVVFGRPLSSSTQAAEVRLVGVLTELSAGTPGSPGRNRLRGQRVGVLELVLEHGGDGLCGVDHQLLVQDP
jgi:hypothetical protein